jgi:hypothetical protein
MNTDDNGTINNKETNKARMNLTAKLITIKKL